MTNPQRQTYIPDHLAAGAFPIVIDIGFVAADQVLKRGSVLGQATDSGEYLLCDAAATDGSETPSAILEMDVDTTDGALATPIRLTGEVLASQLTLGAGHSLAQIKAALRPLCLFVR